ncbi:dual specificity phosphatase, putative [Phytophthora infestans T30-4]|uniref:protein-tyrosine-phosphatase n=1 Tax=Phytophthora infestans (strain T30-4) TaxID=403677 RepID=D0NMN3_PHYIT|nr:dual specificity phosphatase, putative [Phytophthora infestans T30-4]EEY61790.1 dual specificity phosphatase, putative [Phytophthora infestans T30-4]|eukprot:XP_002899430.1 dual specificity phosphatase, putative [Phytophthora infestans T30-4]
MKKLQKPFDAAASGVSTCPTGSNRSAEPVAEAEVESSSLSLSSSCLSFASRRLRRRRLRNLHARVPLVSVTSLFNRLQTSGVVLVDCRKGADYSAGHLPGALHCPPLYTGSHLSALSCAGQVAKTVDDVLEHSENAKLRGKLERRDLMEVVVIGGNHTGASFLYKMDWGYRFAKMLVEEGRVFSVRFLAQGFPTFAKKYNFMLVPSSAMQFPNEIVDGFLYLGNFWQANSAEVIDALQITHVVNMGAITDHRNTFEHVEYLDVAIKDNVDVDIAQEFGPTIEFIQKAAAQNGRVLIHCVQGVSRSSTICIWYVMLDTKCTLSAAYSHVLKCRPLIFPNRGFMAQLIANERELYGDQSVMEDELELLQNGLLPPIDRSGSVLCETFLP